MFDHSVTLNLAANVGTGSIYYTLDDSDPTSNALRYSGAFGLTNTTTVKAAVFDGSRRVSDVTSAVFVEVSSSGGCVSIPGLIGWWKGDGNAADAAGSNPGTLVGDAKFASGVNGQAFSFDPHFEQYGLELFR